MNLIQNTQSDIDLTVSIISTNERHYLNKLLLLLYKVAEDLRFEIIIIDNCSDDGTHELENEFQNLHVIRNTKKLNFSANHNKAINNSKGNYILVLNPDVLFDENEPCLARMIEFMKENPDCGVSGCRVYNFDKEFAYPARKYQNLKIILARRLPFFFNSRGVIDNYLYKDKDIHDSFTVDWLSGCFMLFSRIALEEIGLFDEKYQKYFEDVDMCKRLWAKDWKVIYNGATYYYHLEQRASKRIYSKDAFQHFRSWIRWVFRQKYYISLTHN